MDVLNAMKLLIDDFGKNEKLDAAIQNYHRLLEDFMGRLGNRGVFHTKGSYVPFA